MGAGRYPNLGSDHCHGAFINSIFCDCHASHAIADSTRFPDLDGDPLVHPNTGSHAHAYGDSLAFVNTHQHTNRVFTADSDFYQPA
jgi:hypothetical protein